MFSLYVVNAVERLTKVLTDSNGLKMYEFLNTSVTGECVSQGCTTMNTKYTEGNIDTCDESQRMITRTDASLPCIEVKEYDPVKFKKDVGKASRDKPVRKVWVPWSCNQAIAEEIPEVKHIHKRDVVIIAHWSCFYVKFSFYRRSNLSWNTHLR